MHSCLTGLGLGLNCLFPSLLLCGLCDVVVYVNVVVICQSVRQTVYIKIYATLIAPRPVVITTQRSIYLPDWTGQTIYLEPEENL